MATASPATRPTTALAERGRKAPRPSAATALPRLAAVDIGTNSIRLVIAEVQPDGSYRVLDQDREMSRLGRGIVDTFLEHSRVFYFENGGDPRVLLASADWMPRNFWHRIETVFPVESPALKAQVIGDILRLVLGDNVKARDLLPDGTYQRQRRAEGTPAVRAQVALQELAREAARETAEPRPPFVPIVRRPRSGEAAERTRSPA